MERSKYRCFTVILVPSSEGACLRFRLSLSILQLSALLVICLVLVTTAVAGSYVALLRDRDELEALRDVTRWQQKELTALESSQNALYTHLYRVLELDDHVRELSGIYRGAGNPLHDEPDARASALGYLDSIDLGGPSSPASILWGQLVPTRYYPGREGAVEEDDGGATGCARHMPCMMPVPSGLIVGSYGYRISDTGRYEFNRGIDIAVPVGTPVISAADGVVTFSGSYGAYGMALRVQHGDGYETFYAHLGTVRARQGDRVVRGQIIGLVGATGRSAVPTLHYQVLVHEQAVNPARYLSPR